MYWILPRSPPSSCYRNGSWMPRIPAGPDRSRALTEYPRDPLQAPPQDLRASVEWQLAAPTVDAEARAAGSSAGSTPPEPIVAFRPGLRASGMVVRGDFLSKLMRESEIGWGMTLLGIVVAFGLGAVHALSPGHGKTIVAAYLVGSRGTAKHA